MDILQKKCADAFANDLLLIKHNKEFCLTRRRVHPVFVVHGDWAFGTSARQNKNEKHWDE